MLANEIKKELIKMTEGLRERRLTTKDIDKMLQSEFDMGLRKALRTRGDLLELGVLTREVTGKKQMSYEVVL